MTAAANRAHRDRTRAAVFGHYGTACACCGATADLTIDHVNGGGAEHRHRLHLATGSQFHAWLVREGFPSGFQTLCRPCNRSKGGNPACRLWHGDPGKKRCTGLCGQVKALDQFNRNASHHGGHDERCRDCENAARRASYAERGR